MKNLYFVLVESDEDTGWEQFDSLEEIQAELYRRRNYPVRFSNIMEVAVVKEFEVGFTIGEKKTMEWKDLTDTCTNSFCEGGIGPHTMSECPYPINPNGVPLCKRPECEGKEPHRPEDCEHVYDLTP